jgi:hypothetical protein
MFAAYASNIQPTTPMQFPVPVYGLSGPMVVDEYHLETPYRNPSPPYQSYRQEPYYTPPSLDDKPKMPSISVPPTVNLNLLTPPPNHITTAITPQPFAAIPNTLPTQSVKKEMHMAIAGTDSALAGIDTPIARHVGMFPFPSFCFMFGLTLQLNSLSGYGTLLELKICRQHQRRQLQTSQSRSRSTHSAFESRTPFPASSPISFTSQRSRTVSSYSRYCIYGECQEYIHPLLWVARK